MKTGFIGTGNMGGAIISGYADGAAAAGDEVLAYNRTPQKARAIAAEHPVEVCGSLEETVRRSDIVVLGIKPNMYEETLPQIAAEFTADKVLVSMAAGITIGYLEKTLGSGMKIVRIMPNTPARVGCAMTAVSRNSNVGDDIFADVMEIFTGIGRAEEVSEDLMDCVIGVSGSSPAYTYMYIDALAKAAEKNGMDREKAVVFAAQSVMGAAKMVLESDKTPEQLRIDVCSPGGTTIEAVNKLSEEGFEKVITDGFQAAVEKSKLMSR